MKLMKQIWSKIRKVLLWKPEMRLVVVAVLAYVEIYRSAYIGGNDPAVICRKAEAE